MLVHHMMCPGRGWGAQAPIGCKTSSNTSRGTLNDKGPITYTMKTITAHPHMNSSLFQPLPHSRSNQTNILSLLKCNTVISPGPANGKVSLSSPSHWSPPPFDPPDHPNTWNPDLYQYLSLLHIFLLDSWSPVGFLLDSYFFRYFYISLLLDSHWTPLNSYWIHTGASYNLVLLTFDISNQLVQLNNFPSIF